MAHYTELDFEHVKDHASLDDVLSSGYGPEGDPGSPDLARNSADALTFADGDIYQDYGRGDGGFAHEAALHANITSLQSAATYAREVLETLAEYPTLLAQVHEAMRERKAESGPRP